MTEAKHTPGPWEVAALSGWGGPWAIRMRHTSKVPNAHPTWLGIQNIGTEANARLVAAAPELLEALTELLLYHDVPTEAQDPIVQPLLRAGFSAIAKATGADQ